MLSLCRNWKRAKQKKNILEITDECGFCGSFYSLTVFCECCGVVLMFSFSLNIEFKWSFMNV